jgi:hypothetical protein
MIVINLFIFLHIIGDFYTQSSRLSELKKENFTQLLEHVLIYSFPFAVLIYLIADWRVATIFIFLLFTTHLIIDYIKIKYEQKKQGSYKTFLLDQVTHFAVLYILYLLLLNYSVNIQPIYGIFHSLGFFVNLERVLSISIVLLLIYRPTSHLIKMLLPQVKTVQDSDSEPTINPGELIGILERFTILMFGLLNLWPSIALVITAKSIARFKQLEEKQFAEKYLVGTLLSLSITLVLLYIFKI